MKTSAIKILNSLQNKKFVNIIKKFANLKGLLILITIFLLTITSFYFIKPFFFDFKKSEDIIKTKINDYLKMSSNLNGDISYNIFPTPQLSIKNLELKFNENEKNYLYLQKAYFKISFNKLQNINKIKIQKFIVKNQKIEVYPSDSKNYLKYFQKYKVDNLILKNCEIFFTDLQSNKIFFKNFNLKKTIRNNKEKILIDGIFAENKFKIKFINEKNNEKILNFLMPKLNTNLKIIFDKDSNLKQTSGKLNLKVDNNIFLINFVGDDIYKINDSFLRNDFLNSKLKGSINFKNNFFFDLNFQVNQANLRKLFSYYSSLLRKSSSNQFQLSKKINGKAKVNLKRTDSFVGKIENINFNMFFENGDLKIKSGTADLFKDTKVKFNVSLIGSGNNQRIIFFINFLTSEGKKFLKKFNINTENNDLSFSSSGKISTTNKKIKFDRLSLNNNQIVQRNINQIESVFDKTILDEGVFGFLDFFKIKKFIFETSSKLNSN